MRLYRGIKHKYSPEKVSRVHGTDFTDDPVAALRYAHGRSGVLIVVDLPPEVVETGRLSEEFWFDSKAQRLMIWGAFDGYIVALIPAKEARAVVNQRGVAGQDDRYKTDVLRRAITRWLDLAEEERATRSLKECSGVWW